MAVQPLPLVASGALSSGVGVFLEALPRHRHGLDRDTVRLSQAARLLIATADVVAEKGYSSTSVRDIARRAGVSQKTFYELYDGKEDAFLAAYTAIEIVIERMTQAALAQTEPRDMVAAGVRAYLETLAAEPAVTRMLVIEAVGAGPHVLARRAQAFDDFAAALRIPVSLSRTADPTLPDVDDATLLAALGGINELVLQHLVRQDASTLVQLAPTITAFVEAVLLR